MKCSRNISLGRGGDLRRHQETKQHKYSEKDGVGVLPLQSKFGPIIEDPESVQKYTSHISWRALSCLSIGRYCTKLFKLMFPDSTIAKDSKSSHTKATAVLKNCPELLENHFHKLQPPN